MTKPFPGFDNLYRLSGSGADRPYRGKFEHDRSFELTRAEAGDLGPVRVTWAMGSSTPSDLVWTGSVDPLIISSRVRELFEANGLTGWTTYPVDVLDKQRNKRPGYAGLAIVGRCGPIDLSKSTIRIQKYPGGYFPDFVGHFFEESSWDGSDFCVDVPDSTGRSSSHMIVTEAVVALFKHHRISNVRFRRLTEVTWPTAAYEIGEEHLLPLDFKARVTSAYRQAGVVPPEDYR